MTQLKDKDNQNVMPKTTAENVQYDAQYSVAQKIQQLENGGSGSGGNSGVAYTNLFTTDNIVNGKGVVYNNNGAIQSSGQYKCVFIPLDYDTYYCISGYRFVAGGGTSGANNLALAYGTTTSFQNLLVSQFANGAAWLSQDVVFTHGTNIYKQGAGTTVVFKTPAASDLVDASVQLGIVINTTFNGVTPTSDTLSVVKAMYPVEYAGSIIGKNVAFFGDSITQGTDGGFVGKIQSKARLNLATNYGSSGAATPRLASIMLGNPFRESSGLSYKDYMMYQAVVIQIGTNGGVSGNINNDIPDIGIYDISSYPYEYSASGKTIADATVNEPIEFFTKCFANTFYGNIALCIEYVRYINPNCRIFLTTIPPDVSVSGTTKTIVNSDSVRTAIMSLAAKMGVQVIDARANAGLSLTNVKYWNLSSDGGIKQHLNAKGNEMWASYIAHELERLWYNTNIED